MSDQQSTVDEQQDSVSTEQPKKFKKTTSLTSKILRGVSARSPQRTLRWIASLTGEGDAVEGIMESLAEEVFDPDQKPPNTISAWIEYMFAAFQEYEVEFNRAVGSKSEFKISTEPPVFGSTPSKAGPDPTSFTGKIYTKEWALLLRGNYASLEGFIIPCSQLIMFSGDASKFNKFVRIDVNLSNGVRWRLGGEEIHYSQLRSLSMQLFSGLIKVAKGQRDEKAPFVFLTLEQLKAQASQKPSQPMQIPPNVFAANPMAMPGSQFVSREPVNMGRPGPPQQMQQRPQVQAQPGPPRPAGPPSGHYPGPPGGYGQQQAQQGPQTGAMQQPQGPPSGVMQAPPYAQGPPTGSMQSPQYGQGPPTGSMQAPQNPQGPATGAMPAPQYGPPAGPMQAPQSPQGPPTGSMQAPQYAQGPQTGTMQAPQQAQQQPVQSGGQQRTQPDPDFDQSCLFVFRAIDREMEKLSQRGTNAFQQNDIQTADLAIKRSAKLAKLKEQLLDCAAELRESKKE